VWTPDLKLVGVLPPKGGYVRSLAVTPEGKRFVTVGGGGLEVWKFTETTASRVAGPTIPPAAIGGIVVDPSGNRVYTTDYEDDGKVRAYTLTAAALTPAGPLSDRLGRPWRMVVSPDGRWVGASAKSGRVCVWDTRAAGGPAAHVLRSDGKGFAVVTFSADGRGSSTTRLPATGTT